MKKRQIAILGSTGSIGTQTLQVIEEHSDLYEVYCLTANNRVELLAEQAHRFHPAAVVIANEDRYDELQQLMSDLPDVKVYAGARALDEIVEADPIDIVVTAMMGFAGLSPTIHAIKAHKTIALANKETLVVAGELILQLAQQYHVSILPVDSEHSAIFQSLVGEDENPIDKILLTASGGPFRLLPADRLATVTKADALRHPTWDMGAKITIDSATMMNKGFEVIEAKWLFDVEPERIHVVVHPESVIHSMVEFADGAVLAQLGCPDMREPIQLALSYPERLSLNNKKLDFGSFGALTFFEPDLDKFPCLKLAFDAIGRGGNIPCALNAANEAAVAGYLQERIGFYDIASVAADTLACTEFVADPTLDDIFATNEEAFVHARSLIW